MPLHFEQFKSNIRRIAGNAFYVAAVTLCGWLGYGIFKPGSQKQPAQPVEFQNRAVEPATPAPSPIPAPAPTPVPANDRRDDVPEYEKLKIGLAQPDMLAWNKRVRKSQTQAENQKINVKS